MARYSAFLGRRVEVHYRAGDILLPASGTFVADSGRSIFLEQHLMQHGQQKHFRWEIPYQYIVRLEEVSDRPPAAGKGETPAPKGPKRAKSAPAGEASDAPEVRKTSAAGVSSSGDASSLLPAGHPPKIA
jgi:hypothetical protein